MTTDERPESCPTCKMKRLFPLRFETIPQWRTWTCLNPECPEYRRLVDEDDGDHKDRSDADR